MKKVAIVSIIICFTGIIYLYFSDKTKFVKNYVIITDDSLNTLIVIRNPGDKSVKFNLSFNDKFFSSIKDFIRKSSNSSNKEQFALDIFNNLINSLIHEKLFNDWGTIPLVTLNSKGFAICGRQSEIFGQIMYQAGFPSRIIHLNGHAVSEIYFNNAWHLFDTDRKTYFKFNNKILSYKELIQSPQCFKNSGTKKYIANLTTLFEKYTQHFLTEYDNTFNEVKISENDTFLLTLPPQSIFIFPYYPDFKRDFFPYNTKAKLFLQKGFEGVVKNPLVLIDVEGKGKVKYNKQEFSIPDEIELLKAAIIKSKKFLKEIHVSVFSDSLALVYMLNPVFCTMYSKNRIFINASDSLKLSIIKNRESHQSTLRPIHLELLNQYTFKAFELAQNLSLYNIKDIDELYEKQLKSYCVHNNLDTVVIKRRLLVLKKIINEPLRNYAEAYAFYGALAIVLYGNNEEFKNLILSNYKYFKYKEIINTVKI